MNILILTPDRVGSTLLQRLITIAMSAHDYGKPVINLHELTNGLESYYSTVFNQQVLGKPDNRPWGYYQTLDEIISLLDSADHYKTSRLAKYHLTNRKDDKKDCFSFYQYLNENFYIISCRRNQLFEHALSWMIHAESKTLNVYSHKEKISKFSKIYENKIYVEPLNLEKYLDQYKEYLQWVDDHFYVNRYFTYDKDLFNIENFINELPIFPESNRGWKDTYGISWNDWNKCHYLLSDLTGFSTQLALENSINPKLLPYELPSSAAIVTKNNYSVTQLNQQNQQFVNEHMTKYLKTYQTIQQLKKEKVLVTSIPIKLQTLLEKCLLIKNFDETLATYNNWVIKNKFGNLVDIDQLKQPMKEELEKYYGNNSA